MYTPGKTTALYYAKINTDFFTKVGGDVNSYASEFPDKVAVLYNYKVLMDVVHYLKWSDIKCPICKESITVTNATAEIRSIRLDDFGKLWCDECVEKFDTIDWSVM